MNVTDMASPTQAANTILTPEAESPFTSLPTQADTTMIQVITTALPPSTDNTVITVVIVLILLTVAVLAFLLYRYLCHNKGDYRTTGELAPGEDPDEEFNDQTVSEKKEYFI